MLCFWAGLWSQSRRLGLDVSLSRRTNVSSRSRLEKNCQHLGLISVSGGRCLGLASVNYVSCPRPIFGQIVQATLIKCTKCERALDAGGSEALTFSYQISALFKSCYYHIRELNFAVFVLILTSKLPVSSPLPSFILNLTTAIHCTIIFHSLRQKNSRTSRSLACAVTRTPKSSHVTPVLKFLHWLKINERIKYKLLSLTYKVLTTHQPQYLHDSISVQPCHNTRFSSMVAHTRSSLKITNRSFRFCCSLVRHSLLHFHLSHMAFHLHHLHYHRLHLLLLAQYFILNSNLALQQILSSIDLFISYRTDYTESRTI